MAGVPAGRLSIEIVAEIARLQQDLDKAKRAVKAASGDIAASAKHANDNLSGLSSGMAKSAPNAKLAAFGMRNLAFQAQDLGVQLASAAGSSDPLRMALMAFVQQGPQIRDAFKQTGQSVTGLIGGFLRAHPILSAVAVVAGLVAGAFKLMGSEIDKTGELDAFSKSLGLTSEEMKKLEDVGITTGDMFKGLWRTIDQGLGAGKIFAAIKAWAIDAFKTALNWVTNFAAGAYAAFMGTGNAAVAMAKAAKMALTGDFAGALETIKAIPGGYEKAFDQAKKAMSGFFADVKSNTLAAAKDRLAAQAKVIIDDRTEKKAIKEAKSLGEKMAETIAETMRDLMNMKNIITASEAFGDDPLREQREAMEEAEKAKERMREEEERYDREARDRALKTAYDIADIIGGGVGGAIKDLADALDKAFPEFTKTIGEQLNKLSSGLGDAFKAISAGMAVGNATDGIMKGLGIKSSNTGAQIGGGIGSLVGGPIGAIAGSIIGGVVGGMLKKVKKASATIEITAGEAVQTSLTGNSGKLKKVAGAMADSLIGGLSKIADELGGMLGDGIKVSIGQRDKTFRVDLQGLGRTKGMPKFDTEAEAVAFAIQEVIRRGAIVGLRAGTLALVKGEGDLDAQLQKALSFENVFRDLANRANPAMASIDAITKEFEALIDIFDEAQASTEDYAKLQELMALRQREVIEQAFEPIRTMLDDLKAKADEAGDAVRSAFDRVLEREAAAISAYQEVVAAQAAAALDRQRTAIGKTIDAFEAKISGLKASIDAIRDGMEALREQSNAFAEASGRLRDFAKSFDAPSIANLRGVFAKLVSRAQGGDLAAMDALPGVGGDLRDAVIASATDRVTMARELAKIRAGALLAADAADVRKSIADQQLAAAERQVAALEKQIEKTEQQIEKAQAQLDKLGEVAEAVVSVDDALAEMQSAVAAADLARAQMAVLTELKDSELTFADAVAAYEAAKASRDDLIRQITDAGFAGMIEAQKQTGSQMVAALSAVALRATQAAADATAAINAAQAAQAAAKAANDNNPLAQYFPYGIPMFADGGDHVGGMRIVGEDGPELELTGPSRIMNGDQVAAAMGGRGPSAGEIGEATAAALKPILWPMVKAAVNSYELQRRWDGDGLPEERGVA